MCVHIQVKTTLNLIDNQFKCHMEMVPCVFFQKDLNLIPCPNRLKSRAVPSNEIHCTLRLRSKCSQAKFPRTNLTFTILYSV